MKNQTSQLSQRWGVLTLALLAMAAVAPASAAPLAPIMDGLNIVQQTLLGAALVLVTIGWGWAGIEVMFHKATFAEVRNKLIGGAMLGGAPAIAALFA